MKSFFVFGHFAVVNLSREEANCLNLSVFVFDLSMSGPEPITQTVNDISDKGRS